MLLAGSSRAQVAVIGTALGRNEQAPCQGIAQSLPHAGPKDEPPSPQLTLGMGTQADPLSSQSLFYSGSVFLNVALKHLSLS